MGQRSKGAAVHAALAHAEAAIRMLDDGIAATDGAMASLPVPPRAVGPLPVAEAARLGDALAELRREMETLAAELTRADGEAETWALRAARCAEQSRPDLAQQCELRRAERVAAAAELRAEMERTDRVLHTGEALGRRP